MKIAPELVVFDLAGTVVDHGSRAPVLAFCELFRRHNIEASEAEARIPMGKHKRDHIAEMLAMPAIAAQWRRIHGAAWNAADLEALFEEFLPLQLECIPRHAEAIPGVAATFASLRTMGVKIAATTGYNVPMTRLLLDELAKQGVVFDHDCCAAEVPAGRPKPWMIYRCMEALDVSAAGAVVNVGDTLADVRTGRNAGVRSVGVTLTGNMTGLSREAAAMLTAAELAALHNTAAAAMFRAGADDVVRSAADIPTLLCNQQTTQKDERKRA